MTRHQCDGTAGRQRLGSRWFERRKERHVDPKATAVASARPARSLAGSELSLAPRRRAWAPQPTVWPTAGKASHGHGHDLEWPDHGSTRGACRLKPIGFKGDVHVF